MKNRVKNLNLRQIVCCILGVVSLLIFAGLTCFTSFKVKHLQEQQMAERWSAAGDAAQISCFFSQGTEITEETFLAFEAKMKAALQADSITGSSENESARMWASAYSAAGKIVLNNGKKTVEAKAFMSRNYLLARTFFSYSCRVRNHFSSPTMPARAQNSFQTSPIG